jgi:hypothetical protein
MFGKSMAYEERWSAEAVKNLDEILQDISNKWNEKEVTNFKNNLSIKLNHIYIILIRIRLQLSNQV